MGNNNSATNSVVTDIHKSSSTIVKIIDNVESSQLSEIISSVVNNSNPVSTISEKIETVSFTSEIVSGVTNKVEQTSLTPETISGVTNLIISENIAIDPKPVLTVSNLNKPHKYPMRTTKLPKTVYKLHGKVDNVSVPIPVKKYSVKEVLERKNVFEKFYKTADYNTNINKNQNLIVHCNGISFFKLRKKLIGAFDNRIKEAMYLTLDEACHAFSADLGYTHYYEIALVFKKRGFEHLNNGRPHKIITSINSFVSIRFLYHLLNLVREVPLDELFHFRFEGSIAYVSEDIKDVHDYFRWRVSDCFYNFMFIYGRESGLDINYDHLRRTNIINLLNKLADEIKITDDERNGVFVHKDKNGILSLKNWTIDELINNFQ